MRVLAAFLLLAFAQASSASESCAAQSVYLVRHAEKALGDDKDPGLSDNGQRGAQALRDWIGDKPLDAIYATHLRRTQQTALPLAGARDLDLRVLSADASTRLVERLRSRHCGERVLVVGHSNTVPEIAEALGAKAFSIEDTDYGWVYTVTPGESEVRLERYVPAPQ